ncbi:unnamed protein product [Discula destructiva]
MRHSEPPSPTSSTPAGPSNFNLPLSASLTSDLQGLHNLLTLSLQTPHKCTLAFTSSVSVAAAAGRNAATLIPELPITSFDDCSQTGYARSKLVAEHVIVRARTIYGADAVVLRIGQIVGSLAGGRWNADELVPLMVRSTLFTRTMPLLPADLVSWLPVDVCARVALEIMAVVPSQARDAAASVFNVTNTARVSWRDGFLPALNAAGVECTGVAPREWVAGLRAFAETHEGAAEVNPAIRLLQFWERLYGNDAVVAATGERQRAPSTGLVFDPTHAQQASKALANLGRPGGANLVKEGYIARFVDEWRKSWGI